MEGRSLVPLLKGVRTDWRKSFLIEYYSDRVFPRIRQMGYKAVRNERWKYIHYFELEGMDELYDLKTDPYEMRNIIHQPGAANALEEMKREMKQLVEARPLVVPGELAVSVTARGKTSNPATVRVQ